MVRQLGHRTPLARHLAARGLRLLRRVAVVRGLGRAHRRRAGPPLPPPPPSFVARSPAVRSRRTRHVRRPGVQTRCAHPARAARCDRRPELLRAAEGLDPPAPVRHLRHRRLHRVVRELRRPVAASAVAGLAVFHGRPRPVTDGAATVPSQGPVTRNSVVRVGAATVLSALCGYAVLYLAARDLEPAGFSVFAVFWGAFGLFAGASNGLLQESTREVRQARQLGNFDGPRSSPFRVAAGVGVVSAVAIIGTSPLWSWHVFVESRMLSVALLAGGLAGFCLHTTLLGMLAGVDRWSQYGAL